MIICILFYNDKTSSKLYLRKTTNAGFRVVGTLEPTLGKGFHK